MTLIKHQNIITNIYATKYNNIQPENNSLKRSKNHLCFEYFILIRPQDKTRVINTYKPCIKTKIPSNETLLNCQFT